MKKECLASYEMDSPVRHLIFCNMLLGVLQCGRICNVEQPTNDYRSQIYNWGNDYRVLTMLENDTKTCWIAGDQSGTLKLGFILCVNPSGMLSSGFCETEFEFEDEKKKDWISAFTMQGDLMVFGDVKGDLWYRQSNTDSWDNRPAHSDRVSVLKLTKTIIISASYDRTIKLWDRQTKKQVGMFVCDSPVRALELAPEESREMVCADGLGKLYFLSWTE